jgi:DNA-binding winged helix-turn-helix (wHTH) protein/tetratricopeptide (TPR) repeat protein
MSSNSPRFYDFGPFRLDLTERHLLRDGKPVALTPKAFDTLVLLVRNSGRVIEKDEFLKSVWFETYVEDATLAQNIFTIRQALAGPEGTQYVQTIPKRGYRFVANVNEVLDENAEERTDEPAAETDAQGDTETGSGAIRSLAVLPLLNTTDDSNAEHLSETIAESIISTLSLVPELRIKASSTVLQYKGREVDPQEAGRELSVDAVLVGKVTHFDSTAAIKLELVDVAHGWQLWGEEYRQEVSELAKFQDIVAKDISEKLCLRLTGEEPQLLLKARPQNASAYQLCLEGRSYLNTRTKEGIKKAIDCFEQAIEIEPGSAVAHSGLADCYIQFDFYGIKSPWDVIAKARAAATRAIELDNELAEAHTSVAAIKLAYDRDPIGSEQEFKRAIRLNPKYYLAHDGYAHCLFEMGQTEECLAELNLALELEPLDLEVNQHLGWHYVLIRQPDRAIEQLQKTLALGPDLYRARILLGMAYGHKQLFPQSIAEYLRATRIEKTPVLDGFLGYAYAMAGENEAHEILRDLLEKSRRTYIPPYSLALIYTGLGMQDEALEWLEKALIEQSHWRGWFCLTPELDSLRSDVRFTELLQRSIDIGLDFSFGLDPALAKALCV